MIKMNQPSAENWDVPVIKDEDFPHALRILCADDEPMICRTVAHALRRAGYTAITVNDGQIAWDRLKMEPFDLLITDNEMPRLCGEKLVLKVRQNGLKLPIIVMSTQFEFFLNPDNDWLQIVKVLPKPFPLHELVDAVNFALRASKANLLPRSI
jgi:DNA-binding response OmpR family regulator